MLENDREDNLKKICALAILSDQVIHMLNKIFEDYCTKIGSDINEKFAAQEVS